MRWMCIIKVAGVGFLHTKLILGGETRHDFGWGSPTYAVPVFMGALIGMGLLDTRDGEGVEA